MRRLTPILLLTLLAPGSALAGQHWGTYYAAYGEGLEAHRQGRDGAALAALEAAIRFRPQPGRRLRTYGLNFLPEYFPYLHLAEVALDLGNCEAAEDALRRSRAFGREPEDRRRDLCRRLRDLRRTRACG